MAWRLHIRYIILTVSLNLTIALGVVFFDIYADRVNREVFLADAAAHAASTVKVLREYDIWRPDREIIDDGCAMTGCDLALISRQGQVYYGCNPGIAYQVRAQGWPTSETPISQMKILVDESMESLSGAWWIGRYDDRYRLLVIVPRRPEDEGLIPYLTLAAGITGAGVLLTLIVMLAAANWMLRRPMAQLIDVLTSALVRDVKRRREAEELAIEARLEAERHLQFLDNLLNASEDMAIVASNEDGIISLFNRVAEGILGIDGGAVVGVLTLDQLLLSIQPETAVRRETLQPFMQNKDGEQLVVDQQGEEHIIQMNSHTILDRDDKLAGTLLIFSDITEKRQVEAELRSKQMQLIQSSRMATLGEMATGVAHELNQPLNHIGLLATRLARRVQRRPSVEAEDMSLLREKLKVIQEQVTRAAKIIDHLRTFGRAEPAPLKEISIAEAVQGALQLTGEQLRLHNIELVVDIPEDLPPARGDVARLEQVLINLIVNARYALDEYALELEASGKAERYSKRLILRGLTADDGVSVMIEVEDNGPGMSEDVAARVFEPFFTTKEVGTGTGLGLSISYGIVREFGGMLTVETEPDNGSIFTINLKRTLEEDVA
jgi:PAS domain S-box-containing protein